MTKIESTRYSKSLTIYMDEAKFYDKPDLRLIWGLPGVDSEIVTYRSGREKMIVYGAYSPQIGWIYTQEMTEATSETTASFFISLRAKFPHHRLDIVLDNAKWHYGYYVKDIVKRFRLHLHYLPTYSPDLNPIEMLWLWTRQERTYNTDYSTFGLKKQAIHEFWSMVGNQPEILQKRLIQKFRI